MIHSFKNHPLAASIDAERHQQFMKEALPHLIGGLITGGLLYFVFNQFMSSTDEIIWLVSLSLLFLSTITFYTVYFRYPHMLSLTQWEWIIFAVAMLWGIVWALPPFILLGTSDSEYIAALLVIIVAMAITPAPGMVQYPAGYFIFMSMPLFSLFIKLLHLDLNIFLVLFVPFFWLTAVTYGWRLHQTIIESIRLRLEIEESRQASESANLAKSKFLAAASHDLRQPLQAIQLFLTAFKEKLNIKNEEPLMNRLESSVNSMSELLNSLLDVSKLDAEVISPKAKHLDLSILLAKSASEYSAVCDSRNLEFKLELNASHVYADPVLLERVLGNLLNNATRYTHQGNVTLRSESKGELVKISVIDTGLGIANLEQDKIFTEFHQLNNPERDQKKGLGLGLAIVKRLCDLQDWKLSLKSDVDIGSQFSILVPIGQKKLVLNEESPQFASSSLSGVKVLVIEDDESIHSALLALLNGWGVCVEVFFCIQEGQGFLSKNPLWQPDLILSDFRLRNNETGIQGIKLFREFLSKDVPAILMTGDTAPERIQQAKQSGLVVIHKPIKAGVLRNVVQRTLAQ